MKLTEKEIELFNTLSKSQIGSDLISYLDRLSDYVCDVRTWTKDDTKESAMQSSRIIKDLIRDRIRIKPGDNKTDFPSEYL